jgi:hypothetical protein
MTTLLSRAQTLAAKVSHNPAVLAATIEAGVIPMDATVAVTGSTTVVFRGDRLDQVKADGSVAKSMPIRDQAAHEMALVQYAVFAARI